MYNRAYTRAMECRWDPEKAAENQGQYGVDFADAVTVLHDERGLTMACPDEGPPMMLTVGRDAAGAITVLRYRQNPEVIQVFAARAATEMERQRYEAHQ